MENMHDVPYTVCPGPEVTAAMAVLGAAVRQSCPRVPLGVQVLCAANQQAIAIALAAGNGKGSSLIPAGAVAFLQTVPCADVDTMKSSPYPGKAAVRF